MDRDQSYKILGVSPGAPASEVRDAYLALVKKWHPDRFAHDPKQQHAAEQRLSEINEAFSNLKGATSEPELSSPGAPREHRPNEAMADRRRAVRQEAGRARAIASALQRRWAKVLGPAVGAGLGAAATGVLTILLVGTCLSWPLAAVSVALVGLTVKLSRRSAVRYRELTEELRNSEYAMPCPHCGAPAVETLFDATSSLRRLAQTGKCEHCGRSHWLL